MFQNIMDISDSQFSMVPFSGATIYHEKLTLVSVGHEISAHSWRELPEQMAFDTLKEEIRVIDTESNISPL